MVYALLAITGLLLALIALATATSQRHRYLVPKLPSGSLRAPAKDQLERLLRSGRYRGVTVTTRCQAAMAYADREYRFDEAPALPVSGCDSPICECGYTGLLERRVLRDRRSGNDRRAARRDDSTDRRKNRNRRKHPETQWVASH